MLMSRRFRTWGGAWAAAWILATGHVRADGVIVVSVDGLRPDAVTALGPEMAPNFHRLRREGAGTDNARTDPDHTVTLPNHTGMITGRMTEGPSGHGWTGNGDPFPGQHLHRERPGYVASMFDVAHDHGLRTGLFASKSKFSLYDLSYGERFGAPDRTGPDNGPDKIDLFLVERETDRLVAAFVAEHAARPFGLAMLHFHDPDSAGHGHHWDLTPGSPYLAAVRRVDGFLGQILGAAEHGRTWIVVTADHGGVAGTGRHDQRRSPENFRIPFWVRGPEVAPGRDLYALNAGTRREPGPEQLPAGAEPPPVRNADAANLALALLGLPAVPGSSANATQNLRWGP
jgi:predicted AlkP superfamily pyrophosphatase or phosphodiesterase